MSSQITSGPWTQVQGEAITWCGGNLLMAAAAGAGKTSVLVERIIHLVTRKETPVEIDRLLVVTFTEAAAGEMRQRLAESLAALAAARPDDRNLARQLLLLQRARISTLHSFCLQVIRQYCYLLDIDPAFRVADPAEVVLLQQEVLDEVMETAYGRAVAGSAFLQLVDAYGGGRGDAGVAEIILRLYTFSQSQPSPEAWLEESYHMFTAAGDLDDLPWTRVIRRGATLELEQARDNLELAYRLALSPGGPGPYADTLEAEARAIAAVLADWEKLSWDAARTALQGIAFARLPAVRQKTVDPELKARVQELRKEARGSVSSLLRGPLGRPAAELQQELAGQAEPMENLAALVRDFATAYRQAKDGRGLVDFADLEHYCLKILTAPEASPGRICPSQAARQLREQFVEVLVDEYQDINAVQEAILNLVSRQPAEVESVPNLFMVGDIKQSIYRFRLAEPRLFLDKYATYSPEPEAICRRLDLPDNFRSRREVVEAVNSIFSYLFHPRVAELAYDEASRLRCAAGYPPVPVKDGESVAGVEVHLIEAGHPDEDEPGGGAAGPGEDSGGPDGRREDPDLGLGLASGEIAGPDNVGRPGPNAAELETAEKEAHVVAQVIQELVGPPDGGHGRRLVWDKELKTYRPVTYRDIVVLLRATKGQANTYLEVWQQMGLPAYAELGTGYLGAMEVETMLSLLQVIDNPRQDIPLAAVLRSPMVGLTAAELAGVRLTCPEGDFYDAVVTAAGGKIADSGDLSSWAAAAAGGGGCSPPSRPDAAATEVSVSVGATRVRPRADGTWPGSQEGPEADGERPGQAGATPGTEVGWPQAGVGPELAGRLQDFLARLSHWRTACRRGSVADLIWQIYRETGYYDYVAGLSGGAQRQANLRALYDRARQFEGFARKGLFRFLRFIQRLQETEDDLGTARALGENEDVVRVMSIHRSKGLEFPVVIVAGLGRRFNFRDLYGDVLCHRDLGLGPMVTDAKLRVKYPGLAYRAVQEQLRQDQRAEEIRVLYVGLTRARERLVLVGSCRDLPRHLQRWQEAGLAPFASVFVPRPQFPTANSGAPISPGLAPASGRPQEGPGSGPEAASSPSGSTFPAPKLQPPVAAGYLARARSYLDWLGPVLVAGPASRGGSADQGASRADGYQNGPDGPGGSSCPAWNITLWNIPGGRGVPEPQPDAQAAAGLPWEKITKLEPIPEWPLDPDGQGELDRYLGWAYPFQGVAALPAKTTVTELKYRLALSPLAEDEMPAARIFPFDGQTGLAGPDGDKELAPAVAPELPVSGPMSLSSSYMVSPGGAYGITGERAKTVTGAGGEIQSGTYEASSYRSLTSDLLPLTSTSRAGLAGYGPTFAPHLRRPRFLRATGQLTWTEKGIVTHTVLQHLDLTRPLDVTGVRQQVQEMVVSEILTPEEAAAIDLTPIARFFAGPLGRRLTTRTALVRREMSFSLALPAGTVYPDLAETRGRTETVLVQGSVDCLVDEDDGFLLIDFKTSPANPDLEATQIRLYALAVQTIFHRPVKEAYLYFLPAGKHRRVSL